MDYFILSCPNAGWAFTFLLDQKNKQSVGAKALTVAQNLVKIIPTFTYKACDILSAIAP